MLKDIVLLVVGAALGVVLAVTMQPLLTRHWQSAIAWIQRMWYRVTGRAISLPSAHSFVLAGRKHRFLIVDGDGEASYAPNTILCRVDTSAIHLPSEIQLRWSQIEAREAEKRRSGLPHQWNGPLFSLVRFAIGRTIPREDLELHLTLQLTDYWTFQATVASMDAQLPNGETLRERYLRPMPTDPIPFLAVGLGVAMVALTSDKKIILSRRSKASGVRAGELDISFVEGMHPELDRIGSGSGPDIFKTAVRGAKEELGADVGTGDVKFLGFGVDTEYYQWNLLGLINIPLSAKDLLDRRTRGSGGKWETRDFLVLDSRPENLWTALRSEKLWATGWVAIYLALVHEFGRSLVEREASQVLRQDA